MFKNVMQVIFCSVCLFACKSENTKPTIMFSADSSYIVVKGIKNADKLQLTQLLKADSGLNNYFSVRLDTSVEDDSNTAQLVKGAIKISGDSLVFIPEQKFLRGNTYSVVSFIGAEFGSFGSLLKGKGKTTIEPQREKLLR